MIKTGLQLKVRCAALFCAVLCFAVLMLMFYLDKQAVLTVATEQFKRLHNFDVGHYLLSVNQKPTATLTAAVLQEELAGNIENIKVMTKAEFEANAKVDAKLARSKKCLPIAQIWDYENLCAHGGCLYLTSESTRTYCCMNGRA